jgi:D-alanyl-D-alanine dipeptidase
MDTYFISKELLVDVIGLSKKHCTFPICGELAYATTKNFLGRIVDGYHSDAKDICLLTKQAAQVLCNVQNDLNKDKLGLFIFDAYRPHRAVKDFAQWFTHPPADEYELLRKQIHYPHIEKSQLDALGYAAGDVSRHNFGNTVDLTLIHIDTLAELNMGTCFDYFDELSHNTVMSERIGKEAFNNRKLLKQIMQHHGFIPYENEFWHFEHKICEVDGPMDLPIDSSLRGINVN